MFEIMKNYGESYSQAWWMELFNVVFRIFDNMKLPDTQIEVKLTRILCRFPSPSATRKLNGWQPLVIMLSMRLSMCLHSFSTISRNHWSIIFTVNWNGVSIKVRNRSSSIDLSKGDRVSDNEILAKSGTNCLENFVIACGAKFSPHIWERTCACILEVFRSTLPET